MLPKTYIVDSEHKRELLFEKLKEQEYVACDIETSGFNPFKDKILCIGFSYKSGTGISMPLYHRDSQLRPDLDYLQCLFALPNIKWIGHNFKFDMSFLRCLGIKLDLYFDTMLAHYCTWEFRGTQGLKYLATHELGYDDWESILRSYVPNKALSFELVPIEVLLRHNAIDAAATFDLYLAYKDKTPSVFWDVLMPATAMILECELEGVKIDMAYLKQFTQIIEDKLLSVTEKLKEYANINFDSPKQVKKLLFEDLKLPDYNDGSVDAQALEKLMDSHPIIPLLTEYRTYQKIKSVWVDNTLQLVDKNCYIHPDIHLHATVTGRLACNKPNLMAVTRDKDIKKIFTAKDTCLWVESDYKMLELKVAAAIAKDEHLSTLIASGVDVHSVIGGKILGKDPAHITEDERTLAKTITFGILYGRSAYSIAEGLGISEQAAQEYIDYIYTIFPKLKYYIQARIKELYQNKQIVGIQDRVRHFFDPIDKKAIREAINFPIQSLASDITLKSAIYLYKLFRSLHSGSRILFTVHDAIMFEIPEHEFSWVIRAIKEIMTSMPFKFFPDCKFSWNVEIAAGKSWGELEVVEVEEADPLPAWQLSLINF